MASSGSWIPGPLSRATTTTPRRPGCSTALRTISPRWAYSTMFRATSEIAVAISVCSVLENPPAAASSRPFCRAVTISASPVMGTRTSAATPPVSSVAVTQEVEPFLEVQRGRHALQRQAELDHGERHLRLDAHHDRLGAPQLRGIGDATDRARREGIEDVEGRHVDDDAARAEEADPHGDLVTELHEILIRQRGLDGRDQDIALLEDRYRHPLSSARQAGGRHPPASRPAGTRGAAPLPRCRLADRPPCSAAPGRCPAPRATGPPPPRVRSRSPPPPSAGPPSPS